MKQRRKLSFIIRYVLMIGMVLLVANVVLGVISLNRSKAAMRVLINKNMLDVTNTAAGLLDGDALGALTEDDVGSEAFEEIKARLSVFQENVDIRFIYATRQVSEDRFIFTVDPDPEEPAAFGEDIVVSEGLKRAGQGYPAVDDMPLADRWGYFYSAYSPVFDSSGKVAGVIGVDFDAEWYDQQVRDHTISIGLTSLMSVLIGGIVVFLITHRIRKRFQELGDELTGLSSTVDVLMDEVVTMSGGAPRPPVEVSANDDEIEALGRKIQGMQRDVGLYLEYLHTQAYIDALTKVRSASAYHERLQAIDKRIGEGDVRFSVAVFDVNSLKEINDTYGHECGDLIIQGAAEAISKVFGGENTYRIGGDEFAVVLEDAGEDQTRAMLPEVETAIEAFNRRQKPASVELHLSMGVAAYDPKRDSSYREVFARADRAMYEVKKAYYQAVGNNRRSGD